MIDVLRIMDSIHNKFRWDGSSGRFWVTRGHFGRRGEYLYCNHLTVNLDMPTGYINMDRIGNNTYPGYG